MIKVLGNYKKYCDTIFPYDEVMPVDLVSNILSVQRRLIFAMTIIGKSRIDVSRVQSNPSNF